MNERHVVALTLNQQQRELLDNTIARGVAPDLSSLVRLALREYAARRNDPILPPVQSTSQVSA